MNAENFHEYLKTPSKLYQVSFQELKGLMLQYPYSPNIRNLMLVKSMLDKHKDHPRYLQLAALYSIDRSKLKQQVAEIENLLMASESYLIQEDILELRDLSELDRNIESAHEIELHRAAEQSIGLEEVSGIGNMTVKPSDTNFGIFDTEIDEMGAFEEEEHYHTPHSETQEAFTQKEEDQPSIATPFNSIIASAAAMSAVIESMVFGKDIASESTTNLSTIETQATSSDEPLPTPKSNFNSWLQQFQPPKVDVLPVDLREKIQPPKESEPGHGAEDVAKELAAKSILEDTDIATITLAALHEGQGNYDKAIAMYERLSLHYPEKSSFFAAKIRKLKNK